MYPQRRKIIVTQEKDEKISQRQRTKTEPPPRPHVTWRISDQCIEKIIYIKKDKLDYLLLHLENFV